MNCVSCKSPMVVLELQQVEIDHCLDCGGTWLDSGELELLLGDPSSVARFIEQISKSPTSERSQRKCPICNKKMELISIAGDSKVLLDRCRNGHGIWFDRGELEQIVTIFDKDDHHKVLKYLREIFVS